MSPLVLSVGALLSGLFSLNTKPWLSIQANSDQVQPVYLGASPREFLILGETKDLNIPSAKRDLAENQAKKIREIFNLGSEVEFELWPVQNDQGQRTWAFARWRALGQLPWQWLSGSEKFTWDYKEGPAPVFPLTLHTENLEEEVLIFEDLFTLQNQKKDLYLKPEFGNCVWTQGEDVIGGWFSVDETVEKRAEFKKKETVCHSIPQPARWNGNPVSFILRVDGDEYKWLDSGEFGTPKVHWTGENVIGPKSYETKNNFKAKVLNWPGDFLEKYIRDDFFLQGTLKGVVPLGGFFEWFSRKNSADQKNDLQRLVAYLEWRYHELGITTLRQDFLWKYHDRSAQSDFGWVEIPEANLIAVIPGSLSPSKNHPILMADHIDTAFCEDTFYGNHGWTGESGVRISAPGADDNVSATAALLRAAETLKDSHPLHDIWLVHLTGEEYPTDDLGARYFVSQLLRDRKEIGGLVLLDMIAYTKQGDKVFQINPGDSPESEKIADFALEASKTHAQKYHPKVRKRFDPLSYLYNTDGIIFSDSGFPVILINEHINHFQNLNRRHYHETTDTASRLNWDYATSLSKVAIETVAQMSQRQRR